jgi:dTDP-4-amino-4,6-dideoxygalactose transaminase
MAYPVFQPFIDEKENAACQEALSCKYLGMGSYVGEFENALSDSLELGNERGLVAVSTGHAALHLGLLALGVGPGDEVITPSFNNVADFQAIDATGATPVFCDIREDSLCIDPNKARELIGTKTKAIIAMDYGARLAEHDLIGDIAKNAGIPVVHDAAHSFGSYFKGRPVGHQADITMFSFDPIKNITCIDGGALVLSDSRSIALIQEMRMIGMAQRIETSYQNKRDWGYDVFELGFRYHLSNLHASIGLSQLKKLDTIRERRRKLYNAYFERLQDVEYCKMQGPLQDGVIPFILCLRVTPSIRCAFKDYLASNGIETGIHWRPGHRFTRYRDCKSGSLAVTDRIAEEIVSLPFYPDLSIDDVSYICEKIQDFDCDS